MTDTTDFDKLFNEFLLSMVNKDNVTLIHELRHRWKLFLGQPVLNDTVVEDKCLFNGERVNKYLMDEFGQTGKTEPLRFQKRYSQKS